MHYTWVLWCAVAWIFFRGLLDGMEGDKRNREKREQEFKRSRQ